MPNTLVRTTHLRTATALAVALVALAFTAGSLRAQDPGQSYAQPAALNYSSAQLDNLVAPIALYPDPLLAQVLLASTFPDQVVNAAQYVRTNGTDGIDDQYWDVSVKAVAHYPTVLNLMDQRIDWTTSLGQAYAQQSSDVMQAVQHMRDLARAQGNLQNTPQQQVVYTGGNIAIWPAQPQYIYVPVYDPIAVYYRPVFARPGYRTYFSFGVGYPIGAWLIYDWNWPARRIVYTGWYGGGWVARSRPYINITNVYVNTRYRNPTWNHQAGYPRPGYGGQAVPRTAHGVVTPGGYRLPRATPVDARPQVSEPAPVRAVPRTPVYRTPNTPVYRTPTTPVYSAPSPDASRWAQPRNAEVRERPEPARVSPPRASTPRAEPQVRQSRPESRPTPSQPRTAHRRGDGNR